MVRPGIEAFIQQYTHLRQQRWGLLTNAAACLPHGQPGRVALLQAGFGLQRLFAPEHGLGASAPDGLAQPDGTDALTGLPIYSLYGRQLAPSPAQLAGLDGLLFDVPDVGVRFYTYLWSLSYLMEACWQQGLPLWVLDRPNPLGLQLAVAEGPWLDEAQCSSYIGRWNIPVRHSCTLGELARLFAAERMPGLQLTVVPCVGLQRPLTAARLQPAHELAYLPPFVPPSPAIRRMATVQLYPATCFAEGVNLHEGRGTHFPFEIIGAPWLPAREAAELINALQVPGLQARPWRFTPHSGRYAGQLCGGCWLQVTDAAAWRPVQAGLRILAALQQHYPQLQEACYPTAANPAGTGHLDRLTGVPQSFQRLPQLAALTPIAPQWQQRVQPYLLYGGGGA
jgi:uncharacterized protein YbbC (DUF1343 family)